MQPLRFARALAAGARKRGLAVTHTWFNPRTHRSHCGRCNRELATGVVRCICGAEFVGHLEQ